MSRKVKPTLAIEWSPRGILVHDHLTGQEKCYDDLLQASHLSGKRAIIGISRRSMFLRAMRVPDSDPTTVRQILSMRAPELFPVGSDEIAMDYLPLSDVNAEGRLSLVVGVPTGDLRRIRHEAKEIGLVVDRVVPVALGSAIIARSLARESIALVSKDSSGVGIDVIAHGELRYSRTVPRTALLEPEVSRTYSVAGLPVGDTVSTQDLDSPGLEPASRTSLTPLAALVTHWPDDWHLNMELPEQMLARTKAEVAKRMRLAVAMAAAAGGLLFLVADDYNSKAAAARAEVLKVNKLKAQQEKLKKGEEAKTAKLAAYQTSLDRAFKPAQTLGEIMALIANDAPSDVWLTGATVERGKQLIIRGTSKSNTSVTAYVDKLRAESRLRDVQLVFANNAVIDEVPVVQFSVTAFPVGNLPLAAPRKSGTRAASVARRTP